MSTRAWPAYLWHETPHHEWICEELGVLVTRCAGGWYAYPFNKEVRMGPFESFSQARADVEAKRGMVSADNGAGRSKP